MIDGGKVFPSIISKQQVIKADFSQGPLLKKQSWLFYLGIDTKGRQEDSKYAFLVLHVHDPS